MYKKARTCPNGSFNFGRWLINMGNSTGIDFIEQAFAYRDIPAMYYLNELNSVNQVTPCETSLGMLKYYVERFDPIVTSLEWSFFEMIYGRPQNALIGYAMAAEQGYESAQASAAYLLYQLPDLFAEESESMPPRERLDMAITYLTRSSKTFNIESANVLGDIYSNLEEYEKALVAYDHAATKSSSQAHFNLGWLYENGYGCDKDFNLAKRHYDLALSYNPRAYLVVKLSLLKLRVKSFINDITGGTINGIHNDNDGGGQIQKKTSWRDWMELYRKVKDSSFGTSSNPDNNEDSANKPAFDQESSYNLENNGNETDDDDDDDSESEYEDFLLLSIFILAMAGFMLFHFLNQRQIRRQPNGINVPGNRDPQFNFRIIAI
jgi:TPR repeat protein